MFQEAHVKLDLDETASVLDVVNEMVEGSLFDPLETTILAVDLPFYEGWRFLDIADHATSPPLQRYVFQKEDGFIMLDWSFRPIYVVNELAPVKIDEETVLDYVRFFFSHVRGKHGRFILCESLENVNWKEEPPVTARKSFADFIKPMEILEKREDGVFKIDARMLLKDALFKVNVYVEPSGRVTLTDHEVLIEDMPVLDHVFAQ